jgi:phosphatidate cytidylyltransferase
MLKQRIITALLLAPLIIWGIFALSEMAFNLALAAVIGLAGWEWARLAGWQNIVPRIAYSLFILLLLYGITTLMPQANVIDALFGVVLLWWLWVLIHLFSYRRRELPAGVHTLSALLAGIPVLVGTYFALVLLRQNPAYGPAYIMMLMFLVWGADTAAYFAGRRFGKNKLLLSVSPGKSWEGVWGALIASLILGVLGAVYFEKVDNHLPAFMLVSLLTVIFSIIGDLNESYFKRRAGVKDSGTILPGHGGILDRIDSLTSAAPVFYYGLVLSGV